MFQRQGNGQECVDVRWRACRVRHALLALVLSIGGLAGGGCIDTTKPAAVAACAEANSCVDNPLRDAAGDRSSTTSNSDASVSLSKLDVGGGTDGTSDAPASALDGGVGGVDAGTGSARDAGTDAMGDARAMGDVALDAPSQIYPDAAVDTYAVADLVPGADLSTPDQSTVVVPEAGPEAEGEPGAEPAPEPQTEPGAEPQVEPGPEPQSEPAPEYVSDAGVVSSCPTGAICDDFEDGDNTANPAWTAPANFSVTTDGSKVLAYTGSATPAIATVGSSATDLTIQAKVKATQFGGTSNSYRVGVFARVNSQSSPTAWYGLTITGDGSLRLQTTDSTPSGCAAVTGAASANTWYILTLAVSGTTASTTLQGTLTDASGANTKTIGPCTLSSGLAAGWAGVGVRGAGTHGEFDDVQISGIVP